MNKLALIIVLTLTSSFAWCADKEPTRFELLLASPEIQGLMAFENGDYETALSYMLPLAKEGNVGSQMLVGYLHEQGLGVLEDDKAAIKWYLLAAKQNDLLAQARLGRMYEKGTGVEQTTRKPISGTRSSRPKVTPETLTKSPICSLTMTAVWHIMTPRLNGIDWPRNRALPMRKFPLEQCIAVEKASPRAMFTRICGLR